MKYFAYGSNMNHEQMKTRCPSSRFITKVFLEGYTFVYDGYSTIHKGAVANVIPSIGEIVWGGLFEINEDSLSALDFYEGYPTTYQRKELEVKDGKGQKYCAMVYLRDKQEIGEPSEEYRNLIIRGAKDCGLLEKYINNVL
jgi:gamma-glutamylcyclotransferase (GGCT)/AIG2-like uncharacterized protein YtfP